MFTADQAQFLAGLYAGSIAHEFETTRRVLKAMPEDKLEFKLGEKGRTARELLWHIVVSEIWFGQSIVRGDFTFEGEPQAPATVAEIVAEFERRVPELIEKVKALPAERLLAPLNFFNVFNMPAVLYLDFWKSHSIHHRGQASSYLRALNARVPDIYGGSADEPFQMPAEPPKTAGA